MTMNAPLQRGLRVGVTLYLRGDRQSIWENGIFQNCFFLLMLLKQAPLVSRCFVVRDGPGSVEQAGDFVAGSPAPIIGLDEAMNELDVLIELSAQISPEWTQAFRARGGKIVGMRVANDLVIDGERMAYGLSHGLLFSGTPYHAIWTLPAFEETCAGYYKIGNRAPVRVMGHLWSPHFVEQAVARNDGAPFAYRPGRKRWRLAIMEPNICSVKTCHLPMLTCDLAHRTDPNAIEVLRVFNALQLKEHAGFVGFATSLDLVKHGIASFEGRFPIFDILQKEADALVSHHWLNGQNYLHYEALHGGFPLIHNSAFLGDCGYRYRDFDCEDGALALLEAFRTHDLTLDAYRTRARRFLQSLHPEAEANVRAYEAELTRLFDEAAP